MLQKRHRTILSDLLSAPTAPFLEDHIRRYIFDFCGARGLKVREDKVGNILVHYRHPSARIKRPVCLCAHMDHPGFHAARTRGDLLQAKWYGGVPPEYFRNARVRFYCDGQWIRGRIVEVRTRTLGLEKPQKMVDSVDVRLIGAKGTSVPKGAPGMWDFPPPSFRNGAVHAGPCDDLAGVAAILCSLDRLVRTRARSESYALFTRAEEVGFIGAIAACRLKTIPRRCLVVAIETSSVLPGVALGGGPILRVGDKSSIFAPALTTWCGRIADELARKDRKFKYQCKLMDGGSCESTAYGELGYDTTGICIALGNYHNCDRRRKKLAPEHVSTDDVANLIKWFVALQTSTNHPTAGNHQLRKRLAQLERRYHRLLTSTV